MCIALGSGFKHGIATCRQPFRRCDRIDSLIPLSAKNCRGRGAGLEAWQSFEDDRNPGPRPARGSLTSTAPSFARSERRSARRHRIHNQSGAKATVTRRRPAIGCLNPPERLTADLMVFSSTCSLDVERPEQVALVKPICNFPVNVSRILCSRTKRRH
jgi:hypothetical protein